MEAKVVSLRTEQANKTKEINQKSKKGKLNKIKYLHPRRKRKDERPLNPFINKLVVPNHMQKRSYQQKNPTFLSSFSLYIYFYNE